jgi:hypothetical protein
MKYNVVMSIVLKDLPEALRVRLEQEASANSRTVDQEALVRLQRSFELDALNTARDQQWIDEALVTGSAHPKNQADWDALKTRVLQKRK